MVLSYPCARALVLLRLLWTIVFRTLVRDSAWRNGGAGRISSAKILQRAHMGVARAKADKGPLLGDPFIQL